MIQCCEMCSSSSEALGGKCAVLVYIELRSRCARAEAGHNNSFDHRFASNESFPRKEICCSPAAMGAGRSRSAVAPNNDKPTHSRVRDNESFGNRLADLYLELLDVAFRPFVLPPVELSALHHHPAQSELLNALQMAKKASSLQSDKDTLEDELAAWHVAAMDFNSVRSAHPSNSMLSAEVAAHTCIGHVLVRMERTDEADAQYQKVIELTQGTFGERHTAVIRALVARAEIMQRRDHLQEAVNLYEQVVRIEEAMGSVPSTGYAAIHGSLGLVLEQIGEGAKAMKSLQTALAMKEALFGREDPRVASTLKNMAVVLDKQGKGDAASMRLQRALKIEVKTFGEAHTAVGQTLNNMGLVLLREGNLVEASTTFARALKVFQSCDTKHPSCASALNNYGISLMKTGELKQALPKLTESLALKEAALAATPNHPSIANSLTNVAVCQLQLRKPQEAAVMLKRAMQIDEQHHGKRSPVIARKLALLGDALMQQEGQMDNAIEKLEEALEIYEETLGEDSEEAATALAVLGEILMMDASALDAAASYLEKALQIFTKKRKAGDPQVVHLMNLKKACDRRIEDTASRSTSPTFRRRESQDMARHRSSTSPSDRRISMDRGYRRSSQEVTSRRGSQIINTPRGSNLSSLAANSEAAASRRSPKLSRRSSVGLVEGLRRRLSVAVSSK